MIEIDVLTLCPGCGRAADSKIFGVSTQLGPELVRCPNCETEFRTGRKEWRRFAARDKWRFALLTVLYAAGCGATGAFVYQMFYCTLQECSGVGVDHWTMWNAAPGALFFSILVGLTQWRRVHTSLARSAAPVQVAILATTWDLQLSVQNKFRAVFIILCLLSLFVMWGRLIF